MSTKRDEQYSEQETQRRFEKLLRSALTTPPKPLKSISPKKRAKSQAKLGKIARAKLSERRE